MHASSSDHTCVFGMSWGDEGKGKIVDLLCPAFDVVVRFNGGANAGHTVCVGSESFALHLLPSGVLHEGITSVIGPGVVVDPLQLLKEIDDLAARGIDVRGRLKISDRAHLVLAHHRIEDQLSESAAKAGQKIGTTARGIGPCYSDKTKRTTAVRFADLLGDDGLETRVRALVDNRRTAFTAIYGEDGGLSADQVVDDLRIAKDRLADLVFDTTELLHGAIEGGRSLLFEAANGALLDVDHGTFPFVTSSSTGPHGIGPGAGVPGTLVTRRIGVLKAYATRVGSGPFVSELTDATGDHIREQGHEYGTTTGRPRRCGWFDAVAGRYTARLCGVTDVALLHLDTLSGFDQVGICTGYMLDGQLVDSPPASAQALDRIEPVIECLPGWSEDLRSIRVFEDLPETAKKYVLHIESLLGSSISLIGVGPDRSQTLVRGDMRDVIVVPEPSAA